MKTSSTFSTRRRSRAGMSGIIIFAILALLSLLMFGGVVAMQFLESQHYSEAPSLWLPK